MTPEDETELHRLAAMLEQIDKTLPDDSPLREALQKAGYSLSSPSREVVGSECDS